MGTHYIRYDPKPNSRSLTAGHSGFRASPTPQSTKLCIFWTNCQPSIHNRYMKPVLVREPTVNMNGGVCKTVLRGVIQKVTYSFFQQIHVCVDTDRKSTRLNSSHLG